MLRRIILFLLFLLPLTSSLNQGIIIACNDHYMKYLIPSLKFLRDEVKCTLPIEVWHAGDELSDENQKLILTINNTTIKDLSNYYSKEETLDSRGWQIKAYMLKTTNFEEVVLMDADVFLLQNPSLLLNDENYLATGAYFFRDLFMNEIGKANADFHLEKSDHEIKEWFLETINTPSKYVIPEVVKIINDQLPISFLSIQESGLVIINKIKHKVTIDEIFNLNKDHKNTYQYLYGDKDTFWIACEKTNQPYYFNPTTGVHVKHHYTNLITNYLRRKNRTLTHLYNNSIIFIQKQPRLIADSTSLLYKTAGHDTDNSIIHSLTIGDEDKLKMLHKYYKDYTPKLIDKIKSLIK